MATAPTLSSDEGCTITRDATLSKEETVSSQVVCPGVMSQKQGSLQVSLSRKKPRISSWTSSWVSGGVAVKVFCIVVVAGG